MTRPWAHPLGAPAPGNYVDRCSVIGSFCRLHCFPERSVNRRLSFVCGSGRVDPRGKRNFRHAPDTVRWSVVKTKGVVNKNKWTELCYSHVGMMGAVWKWNVSR